MILYLASTNPGKLREFRNVARARGVLVEALPGIDRLPACIEDGATFGENALKKVLHYSAYVAKPVFADDSGICVDALGGAPGVYSARYAQLGVDLSVPGGAVRSIDIDRDAANNARLLAELEGVPVNRRSAHYICVIALAQTGRLLETTEGRADGVILESARGQEGFGYDPHFFFPSLGKTFAELSLEEKSAVSHRGEAFRKLLDFVCTKGPA